WYVCAGYGRHFRWVHNPRHRALERTLRTCPQANHPFLDSRGHRRRLAFTGDEFGARNVFVPGIRSTEDFDIGATLAIGPSAGDLDPLTRRLVADAGSILRHIARLPVHLHGALALIFERHDQILFQVASEHTHIPAPVEEDCFQVLRTGSRGVQRRAASAPATAALRASAARTGSTTSLARRGRRCSTAFLCNARGGRADRQSDCYRDTCPRVAQARQREAGIKSLF